MFRTPQSSDTISRQVTLLSIVIITILLAQGCSMSKAPSLEEAGTPPQSSMESEIPREEPGGQYSIKISGTDAVKSTGSTASWAQLKIALRDAKGNAAPTVKDKDLNLLLVSSDGKDFQRLGPKQTAPGSFECTAIFPHEGKYKACLQFTGNDDKNFAAVADVVVGKEHGGAKTEWTADADKQKAIDGYEFAVHDYPQSAGPNISMPTFRITKDVRPVSNLEPINDKAGYAVVVSETGDKFYRTIALGQPSANKLFQQPVMFHVIVPEKGNYKIWAQFKIDGKVHTVGFGFKVD